MNNEASSISLDSTFKEDMEKFHGLRPNCNPSPPTEAFSELLENMFEEAFHSPSSDPLGWSKMLSVLYPFMPFPGGRERTIFIEKHLETRATGRQALHRAGSASCKSSYSKVL